MRASSGQAVVTLRHAAQQAASGALAIVYLGLPLGMLVAIHLIGGGRGAVLLLVFTIVVGDSTALRRPATGSAPARAPPQPLKTIEGALGGFVAAPAFVYFAGPPACWWVHRLMALLGLALVGAGIAGDLFESLLKRAAAMKDSSSLIPGHGGVDGSDRAALHDTRVLRLPAMGVRPAMMSVKRRIAILGSTGSIGTSVLAVADAHPDRIEVVGLAAGGNSAVFAAQLDRYRPRAAAMASGQALDAVRQALNGALPAAHGTGSDGLIAVATHPDVDFVLCASSGTAALEGVLAAIDAGKTIGLANKEVLVMAGGLVMDAAARRRVPILPVDSEHNAIHQCLHGRQRRDA